MPAPEHYDKAKSEVIATLLNAWIETLARLYAEAEAQVEGEPDAEGAKEATLKDDP